MRVVVKVGTSLIAPGGHIDVNLLRGMIDQFDLSSNEYLIVTSGAIAAGMSGLSLEKRPGNVPAMQACASPGLYFEVSPTQGISQAMNALFQKVISTAHITN